MLQRFTFRSYADSSLIFAQFTTPDTLPFHTRLMWYLRQSILSVLGYPVPCRYISRQCVRTLNTGYLVIDYIEETHGKMLSESWEELRYDKNRRLNLFNDLSRIMLSLAQSVTFATHRLPDNRQAQRSMSTKSPSNTSSTTSRERGNPN